MPRTIPTVDDLASDVITHHYDDLVAPAGLTNFLGTVQVGHDLTALHAVTFPPVSQGLAATGVLFVDGRVFESYGVPIAHAWRPDRVVRSARSPGARDRDDHGLRAGRDGGRGGHPRHEHRGCAPYRHADPRRERPRDPRGRLVVGCGVPEHPQLGRRRRGRQPARLLGRRGVRVERPGTRPRRRRSPECRAARPRSTISRSASAGSAAAANSRSNSSLEPSGTERVGFVQSVATTREEAVAVFDRVAADVPAAVASAESFWNGQLEAIFTPGNSEYSGHLPDPRDVVGRAPSHLLVGCARRDLVPPRIRRQRARPQLRHPDAELLVHDDVHLGLQPQLRGARDARPSGHAPPAAATGSPATSTPTSAHPRSPAAPSAGGTRSTTTR